MTDIIFPSCLILGDSQIRNLNSSMLPEAGDLVSKPSPYLKNFGIEGLEVRMCGVGGRTIAKLRQWDLHHVGVYSPDIIIIHAGGNDLANGESPEYVALELVNLAAHILHKFPNTKHVIFSGVPQRHPRSDGQISKYPLPEEFNVEIPVVHKTISNFIQKWENIHLWQHKFFTGHSKLLSDGVHFNQRGQYLFYKSLRDCLAKAARNWWDWSGKSV
jgi:lysophospholipase L1-like esterase